MSAARQFQVYEYAAHWQGWSWKLYATNIRNARRDALTESRRMFRKLVESGEPIDHIPYPLGAHVSVTRHGS